MPPRGGRGSGRGRKHAPALGARRVVLKRERGRSSDRLLDFRMGLARAETGHPAPSFHGLTTEQSEADDEATALRGRLQSLGGEIPGGRWASDIKCLKKKIAALGGGGDDNNSDDNSGDESAAAPTNQEIQRIDADLSGGSLSYEERMLAIEERALRQDVCETSGYRRRLGQQVNQAQQRSIQAQNSFKIKSSVYEKKKRADNYRGELLRTVRAALGSFRTNVDYLPAFKEAFQLIYNHRVVFEEQAESEDTFAALQQEQNEATESAEDKLLQARQLQRQRRSINNRRQSCSDASAGFGVDDGTSVQRAVASRALHRHDSLIMVDDSEEEEDEEGESSVAAETLNLLSRTTSSAARAATSPRSAPEMSRDDDW